MPKWFRIITGIFLIFSLLFAGIIFIGYRIVSGSLPKTSGIINANNRVHSKISVFRDGYGIPHIISNNRYDMFFAQGFVTAQDRLWQMDIQRRTAYGKLSEILGTKAIPTDSFMLVINIGNTAEKIYQNLSRESKEILQAYCDGINYYISSHKKSLPVEFRFLNYTPEPWNAQHSIAVLRLFAWQSSRNFLYDAFSLALKERSGNKLNSFFSSSDYAINTRDIFAPFLLSLKNIFRNALPIDTGSNFLFCVPSYISDTNASFMAFNYTSLAVIPGPWYEIYLASPEMNVQGFSLPGVPLIFTGQNRSLSWIFSATGKRDCRYSEISTSEVNTSRSETIKSFPDSVLTISVDETDSGPIIYKHSRKNKGIALIWNGYKFSDDLLSLFNICKSNNLDSFKKSASDFGPPSHIFLAGDTSGRFAVIGTGINQRKILRDCKIFSHSPFLNNRIEKLLNNDSTLSLMKIKNIVSDAASPAADSVSKLIIPVLLNNKAMSDDPVIHKAIDMLSKWDGSMLASKSEASIINTFLVIFTQRLLKPVLGEELYELYAGLNTIPYESLVKYLSENKNTDKLILSSFSAAIDTLKRLEGSEITKWSWGKFHTVTFSHILGNNPLLSSALNLGPFPVSGCSSSLFNSGSFINSNPGVDIFMCAGAIYDVSNPDNSISVLSTGQSGQPVDEHYRDQVNLSVKNLFHPSLLDTTKVRYSGWKHLIIKKGNIDE